MMRPNRFIMMLDVPFNISNLLGYGTIEIRERLALTVSSISLPAKSFMTHDMAISTPNRLIPYGLNTNNSSGASFEFHVLADMFEKNLFEKWQNLIVNPTTKESGFYNSYAKDSSISIVQLPNWAQDTETAIRILGEDIGTHTIKLTEVYPYNIQLNNGSQNYGQSTDSLKMKVDFMYREIRRGNEAKPIRPGVPALDNNGNFVATIPDGAGLEIVDDNGNFVRDGLVSTTIEDTRRDWEELQRREAQSMLEKIEARKKYDQSRNVPRGVDGRLINPQTDGLPARNPNDEIREILNQGLAFISQGQGFLGQL